MIATTEVRHTEKEFQTQQELNREGNTKQREFYTSQEITTTNYKKQRLTSITIKMENRRWKLNFIASISPISSS